MLRRYSAGEILVHLNRLIQFYAVENSKIETRGSSGWTSIPVNSLMNWSPGPSSSSGEVELQPHRNFTTIRSQVASQLSEVDSSLDSLLIDRPCRNN